MQIISVGNEVIWMCPEITDKEDRVGKMIEPFSDTYNAHASYKKIPLTVLQKLDTPMNLICVTPIKIEALFSDFKKDGYSSRQTLKLI